MTETVTEENLESLIQKFERLYKLSIVEYCDTHNFPDIKNEEIESLIREINLQDLAKQIVERLSPDEFASRDDEKHIFGDKLTTVLKHVQDKESLVKIGKIYEELADRVKDKVRPVDYSTLYHYAKKNFLLSGDKDSIIGFAERSVQKRQSIYDGVSLLKEIKPLPQELVDTAFNYAVHFGQYDLAMDIAYLTNDKNKERKVLDVIGLTKNPTVL